MRNVPLVPQGDVFEGRLHVGPHHARQPADLLAGDRIALVRHGRAALLALREILLGFAHFGALQVAHFERDLLAQRAWPAPGRPGNTRAGRAESPGEATAAGFSPRRAQICSSASGPMWREGAHRARDLADAHDPRRRRAGAPGCARLPRTRWPASGRK